MDKRADFLLIDIFGHVAFPSLPILGAERGGVITAFSKLSQQPAASSEPVTQDPGPRCSHPPTGDRAAQRGLLSLCISLSIVPSGSEQTDASSTFVTPPSSPPSVLRLFHQLPITQSFY